MLKRNGVVRTTAAHANMAAPGDPVARTTERHISAAASAAITISATTTAGSHRPYTGAISTGMPTGWIE